jgi:hypothetical protein
VVFAKLVLGPNASAVAAQSGGDYAMPQAPDG